MKLNKLKLQKGFTIIEVMIVLAIAGLIMVIVFVAVPQLQRSERNTARKSVMDRVKTEVDNFASNNSGKVPSNGNAATDGFVGTGNALATPPVACAGGGFYVRYICNNGSQFNDPQTGNVMTFATWANDGAVTAGNTSTIYYTTARTCNGEVSQPTPTVPRNYILMNKLEGGAIQCLDNH